jgi:hypothetical protein
VREKPISNIRSASSSTVKKVYQRIETSRSAEAMYELFTKDLEVVCFETNRLIHVL